MVRRKTMPIYEYRCLDCGRKLSVFWRSRHDVKPVSCRRCGSDRMVRIVSRVRLVRSEESRLDDLADEAMLADLDENDPRSLGRWMRRMSQELGEDLGPEFDEIVGRLEAGESPEEIEKSMPELADWAEGGEDFVGGSEFD
ncbi:MAG: zinc ribbon domain-containing protein [Chloroflexi bacterium]|nr:MAG: zinc ribbon domain-containing protein [Chloroflexota bacterium]